MLVAISPFVNSSIATVMNHRLHCIECLRPAMHCYCERIVQRDNHYPVKLIQSRKESKHPFNTGRIVELSLLNCETCVVDDNRTLGAYLEQLLPANPVLAFPAESSHMISEASIGVGRPIIFIDDTWRKAKRFLYENKRLDALPKICLPPGIFSAYTVRHAKKHVNNYSFKHSTPICTLEAVALSLGLLEGRGDYYTPMLDCLQWVVNKQREFLSPR